eukprot:TRINITY_DN5800_c0_g1_i3.p1 TRINITY_DN5800_c0_g1~~TRINITY_DN5800_c0_g1_i3.p1  ORF type:complete len:508 (+),score=23.77 TRINITY_DN5800_c0_g1_i3:888-2411(+)
MTQQEKVDKLNGLFSSLKDTDLHKIFIKYGFQNPKWRLRERTILRKLNRYWDNQICLTIQLITSQNSRFFRTKSINPNQFYILNYLPLLSQVDVFGNVGVWEWYQMIKRNNKICTQFIQRNILFNINYRLEQINYINLFEFLKLGLRCQIGCRIEEVPYSIIQTPQLNTLNILKLIVKYKYNVVFRIDLMLQVMDLTSLEYFQENLMEIKHQIVSLQIDTVHIDTIVEQWIVPFLYQLFCDNRSLKELSLGNQILRLQIPVSNDQQFQIKSAIQKLHTVRWTLNGSIQKEGSRLALFEQFPFVTDIQIETRKAEDLRGIISKVIIQRIQHLSLFSQQYEKQSSVKQINKWIVKLASLKSLALNGLGWNNVDLGKLTQLTCLKFTYKLDQNNDLINDLLWINQLSKLRCLELQICLDNSFRLNGVKIEIQLKEKWVGLFNLLNSLPILEFFTLSVKLGKQQELTQQRQRLNFKNYVESILKEVCPCYDWIVWKVEVLELVSRIQNSTY